MAGTSWEKRAVLKTFLYAAEFGFPLRRDEVYRRLIAGKKVPVDRVFAQIEALAGEGVLKEAKGFFFPVRSKMRPRKQPGRVFDKKLALAGRAALLAKFVPWVMFVGLTGSLAAGNARDGDDVDLMVITKPKRLWLARGLIYLQFITLGRFLDLKLRRPGEKRVRNKICFNLFLTTNRLILSSSRRSLFTAYQLMFLKPLADKGGVYQRLLQANRFWLKNYLANWLSTLPKSKAGGHGCSPGWRVVDCLDWTAFQAQKKYMSGRLTGEKISRETAFFHPKGEGRPFPS